MKKQYTTLLAAALTMGLTLTACKDDNKVTPTVPEGLADIEFLEENTSVTTANSKNWGAYSVQVAHLLSKDATELEQAWKNRYRNGTAFAEIFKNPTTGSAYTSYINCAEQIIDGCVDIANEVGTAKIGEPRDYWEKGKYQQAVYAVESWYSFHSIEDYSNNILSIQNAINGQRSNTPATHSLAAYMQKNNNALYSTLQASITAAYNAIENMAAPFRAHIGSSSVLVAMDACAKLNEILDRQVKGYMSQIPESELKLIIEQYVDAVVLPTYEDLAKENQTLLTRVKELNAALQSGNKADIDKSFEAAALQWMTARRPWETSEAFLFGPVDELGLDPNMDSWPLDVNALRTMLNNGNFTGTEYGEGANQETVEAAQNVRGFHTLEFLLFKQGKPRTLEE
ncbi:MAG: imelysin family protein [Bacteroidaceae bacterium]|nr:imelysin family protein [Prevotellaceae bacterium]MDY5632853.1 imelysin family protein [Bacteroidaceae bacterium]